MGTTPTPVPRRRSALAAAPAPALTLVIDVGCGSDDPATGETVALGTVGGCSSWSCSPILAGGLRWARR